MTVHRLTVLYKQQKMGLESTQKVDQLGSHFRALVNVENATKLKQAKNGFPFVPRKGGKLGAQHKQRLAQLTWHLNALATTIGMAAMLNR